jgi:DNA-binding Xre family transcriptional regulator
MAITGGLKYGTVISQKRQEKKRLMKEFGVTGKRLRKIIKREALKRLSSKTIWEIIDVK